MASALRSPATVGAGAVAAVLVISCGLAVAVAAPPTPSGFGRWELRLHGGVVFQPAFQYRTEISDPVSMTAKTERILGRIPSSRPAFGLGTAGWLLGDRTAGLFGSIDFYTASAGTFTHSSRAFTDPRLNTLTFGVGMGANIFGRLGLLGGVGVGAVWLAHGEGRSAGGAAIDLMFAVRFAVSRHLAVQLGYRLVGFPGKRLGNCESAGNGTEICDVLDDFSGATHALALSVVGFPLGSRTGASADADGDGIRDDDRCPEAAEDFDDFEDTDGCPDLDDDSDGIPDQADRCPHQRETADGVDDTDGCPEAPRAPVSVPAGIVPAPAENVPGPARVSPTTPGL
jgi:opacity protein-like surface antigen